MQTQSNQKNDRELINSLVYSQKRLATRFKCET